MISAGCLAVFLDVLCWKLSKTAVARNATWQLDDQSIWRLQVSNLTQVEPRLIETTYCRLKQSHKPVQDFQLFRFESRLSRLPEALRIAFFESTFHRSSSFLDFVTQLFFFCCLPSNSLGFASVFSVLSLALFQSAYSSAFTKSYCGVFGVLPES